MKPECSLTPTSSPMTAPWRFEVCAPQPSAQSPRALTWRSLCVGVVTSPLKYQPERGPHCRTDAHTISGKLIFAQCIWNTQEVTCASEGRKQGWRVPHWSQISFLVSWGPGVLSSLPITSLRTIYDWGKNLILIYKKYKLYKNVSIIKIK